MFSRFKLAISRFTPAISRYRLTISRSDFKAQTHGCNVPHVQVHKLKIHVHDFKIRMNYHEISNKDALRK
jgi:hypothetical protein